MTTNTTAATLTLRHLRTEAPFFVRAIVDPIYVNHTSRDDRDVLRSVAKVLSTGTLEVAHLFIAAQYAQDVIDAA